MKCIEGVEVSISGDNGSYLLTSVSCLALGVGMHTFALSPSAFFYIFIIKFLKVRGLSLFFLCTHSLAALFFSSKYLSICKKLGTLLPGMSDTKALVHHLNQAQQG